jgi:hypothetical protein
MPPTAQQYQKFNDLKASLARYIKDLAEDEYNSLPNNLKTHGVTFWEVGVTDNQVWDEMMQQYNAYAEGKKRRV